MLAIVIAGDKHDGQSSLYSRAQHRGQTAHKLAQLISSMLVEDVARDQQEIDFTLVEIAADLLEPLELVLYTALTAQPRAQMPVAGVQDSHYIRS